jgi:phosphoglycolate phosphatase
VEHGGRALTRAQVVSMVGDGAAVLVRRALAAAGLDPDTAGALDRFLALYSARLLDTTRLYEGIADVLATLDPLLPLAVLTNKPQDAAERVLDGLGVRRHFIEVLGGDGLWPRKPDPSGLVSLRLHAGGGPVVLVGDSPIDAETARRGSAGFVLARYGFGAAAFDLDRPTPFVADSPQALVVAIEAALRAGRC